MRETLSQYMDHAASPAPAASDGLFAIAAPHVSPEGGWQSYREAYRMLRPEHRDRTFVILATSHYGAPERFGLTRKTFRTPLGVLAATPLGSITLGGSLGDAGRRKFFFTFGRLF